MIPAKVKDFKKYRLGDLDFWNPFGTTHVVILVETRHG